MLVWPADHSGCGHYRLIYPAEALAAQGGDVTVDFTGPRVLWDRVWAGANAPPAANVAGLDEAPDADVVVIQRPARKHWAQLIPHLQAAGVSVVVDCDDDFARIPAANKAAAQYDPRRSPHHNHDWIARACELADLVTVSTPALVPRYGRHGRVRVLPNLVPASYRDHVIERRDPDPVTIGWSGTVDTHPHDLETTGGAVGLLSRSPGVRVAVVGTGKGVADRLELAAEPSATGWLPFEDYPASLAAFDVGIVPLHAGVFNRSKSALKALEMASVGVPVVASPTPDNARLAKLGVTALAASPGRWWRGLSRLVDSAALRSERREAALAAIYPGMTYEANCGRWAEAWTAVLRERVPA